MSDSERRPRLHVVEMAPLGYRYYRGAFDSFEEVPPRYTWRKVDYRVDDTIIYVDLHSSEVKNHPNLVYL